LTETAIRHPIDERFEIGLSLTKTWPVDEAITVAAHGTVPLPVLATPHLIFMLEDTCMLLARPGLVSDEATVGTAVHIDHLAGARPGDTVDVFAQLVTVRGRRLVFRVEARNGRTMIARGLHERAVVQLGQLNASPA
jgi:fluoroacetyl-CoA thioesterase